MRAILNMFKLAGKTAVIIGGTGILGSAIAKGLGKAGANIVICYHITKVNKLMVELKKEKIISKAYYIDVMDKEKIKDCSDKIIKDFSSIDILVNAAGGEVKKATTSEELSFFDLPSSALKRVMELNLFGGTIIPCQVFGRTMVKNKEGGSIINISSMNAFRPLTRTVGYSTAKAAVNNFTQWLAVYFAQNYNKKLRVNAIAPGFFLTRQNHFLLLNKYENFTPRAKSIISHTPMNKFGKPEDLIGTCIWLASDASRFVTGTIIPVDGGFNAYSGV